MDSTAEQASTVRFGVFEADLRAGELRKNGSKVKVQELPFRALKLFLSRPNQVLSREEFRLALWPDGTFVDFDRGISSTVNRLRETLSDTASNPRFIETVTRTGYRWIAPIQVVAPSDERVSNKGIGARRPPQTAPPPPVQKPSHSKKKVWAMVAGLAVLTVALALFVKWQRGGLRAQRTRATPAVAVSAHNPSSEVEEFYLKGRYYWNKRTPESLNHAVDYFSQAISRDPNYAKAYVGLADSYNLLREYASMPESDAYGRAFAAASKAAELDPSSAEAHASLGFIYYWSKRDLAASSREFDRAIALNPNYVDAYHWYGNVLSSAGRAKEGLAYLNRAQELDPASPSIRADKGAALVAVGQRDDGVALLKQMEVTDPGFLSPHAYLAALYLGELDCSAFLNEARAQARLQRDPDKLSLVQAEEKGFAAGGCPEMLRSRLEVQKKRYAQHRVTAFELAETEALLGDKAPALQYLRLSLAQNEAPLAAARGSSYFRSLHSEPEFRQVILDAGLPPLS
ncbi:MAG TPA: tetratricopeptide repeat protein [Terriglobales bacterium]